MGDACVAGFSRLNRIEGLQIKSFFHYEIDKHSCYPAKWNIRGCLPPCVILPALQGNLG